MVAFIYKKKLLEINKWYQLSSLLKSLLRSSLRGFSDDRTRVSIHFICSSMTNVLCWSLNHDPNCKKARTHFNISDEFCVLRIMADLDLEISKVIIKEICISSFTNKCVYIYFIHIQVCDIENPHQHSSAYRQLIYRTSANVGRFSLFTAPALWPADARCWLTVIANFF